MNFHGVRYITQN